MFSEYFYVLQSVNGFGKPNEDKRGERAFLQRQCFDLHQTLPCKALQAREYAS